MTWLASFANARVAITSYLQREISGASGRSKQVRSCQICEPLPWQSYRDPGAALVAYELDDGPVAVSTGKFAIAGQQGCGQRLCESYVCAVVSTKGVAELPESGNERLVFVTGDGKIGEVL